MVLYKFIFNVDLYVIVLWFACSRWTYQHLVSWPQNFLVDPCTHKSLLLDTVADAWSRMWNHIINCINDNKCHRHDLRGDVCSLDQDYNHSYHRNMKVCLDYIGTLWPGGLYYDAMVQSVLHKQIWYCAFLKHKAQLVSI